MIRRGISELASAKPSQSPALLVVPDAARASEVEQLLLDGGIPVVRTRVTAKPLLLALLRTGATVLLEGISPEAADELGGNLPFQVHNLSSNAPETFLRQFREKGILPQQKGSPR